jgi:hypothetical protein
MEQPADTTNSDGDSADATLILLSTLADLRQEIAALHDELRSVKQTQLIASQKLDDTLNIVDQISRDLWEGVLNQPVHQGHRRHP